ncbi:HAMP domain-containing protein [Nocardioides daphniae]|uniref:HAMP domain-containing protein n=1 Tax=Nocardioides daphniae TaxID=402297 RepID=A0A4P7UBQ2_9ACTN|nr:HAMP domain-containing protein [Nocardioides daphniae]QCC77154.1 HAMP domain-containing protein [Nocardioides daphniae]
MSALTRINSIKVKLGLLVVAASLVTALVATVGSAAGVSAWLSLPVTLLLALVVTQLLAAGMVAPLVQMTEAARAMARGAYDARVLTPNTDEVGQLARSFNVMARPTCSVSTPSGAT